MSEAPASMSAVDGSQVDQFSASFGPSLPPVPISTAPSAAADTAMPASAPKRKPKRARNGAGWRRAGSACAAEARRLLEVLGGLRLARLVGRRAPGRGGRRDQIAGHAASSIRSISGFSSRASSSSRVTSSP